MAAYAAVVSLLHIIEKIQFHHASYLRNLVENPQIEVLWDRASFLQDFLEVYYSGPRHHGGEDIAGLESRIADAAHAAEDILESNVVDRILSVNRSIVHEEYSSMNDEKVMDRVPCLYSWINKDESGCVRGGLERVIKDMDLIKEQAKMIMEEKKSAKDGKTVASLVPSSSSSSSTAPPRTNIAIRMVGFDEYMTQIMEELTGKGLGRRIIPIFGMGGIGKTTLAKKIHVYPLVNEYFDRRTWMTISQEYSVREILSGILREIGVSVGGGREDELGVQLHKELCGRRYLIILDDMWSLEAWEKVKSYFPDNQNGSRIMITTRISSLASHFGSCGFEIGFLDEDSSWKLFCQKIFEDESRKPEHLELVKLGKMIARKCKGLPLSIVTIAGLLAKSEKTPEYWEYVFKNLNSIIAMDDNEHCLRVLSLSYNNLPVHLKPCFLYMGVFREDQAIRVSELVRLWVAEGFLKPIKSKISEKVAYHYLKELIDRNLILVQEWTFRGRIKACYMHDLLRDLCIGESQKDKFLFRLTNLTHRNIECHRRIAISLRITDEKAFLHDLKLAPLVRSISTLSCSPNIPSAAHSLLRVINDEFTQSRPEIFLHVNLRYLKCKEDLSPSINLLWNLETLVIDNSMYGISTIAPMEIWSMPQLRHLIFYPNIILCDPTNHHDKNLVLENLQTILYLETIKLTEEIIRRIPNVKKLKMRCSSYHPKDEEWSHSCVLENLHRLEKLESLYLSLFQCPYSLRDHWGPRLNFPLSLKRLLLQGSNLPWEDASFIGSLPHLELLKLWFNAFSGTEWNPIEGQFLNLKVLHIYDCPLECWHAKETSFPCLEHLIIGSVTGLKEIPLDIGEIPTLQSINVEECSQDVVNSAKEILEQQRDLGNESLQVFTDELESVYKSDKETKDEDNELEDGSDFK